MEGRNWDGKEQIICALAALCKECTSEMLTSSADIILALRGACSRGKKAYREAVLDCLTESIRSFKGVDHYELVAPLLLEACDMYEQESSELSLCQGMKNSNNSSGFALHLHATKLSAL